jgi:GT2 family glycosyltransferase
MVRDTFPGVRLYVSPTNLGYTGGNNLGMRQSRGRYVLLLNPDTELVGDALGTMVSYMEDHRRVGVVGPQLRYPDGDVQSSRRRFPTLLTALIDSTFLEKWWPDHRELRRYKMRDESDQEIADVDWLVGACLLVRHEVIHQVGLLDDEYFMYSEELDWQRRIHEAGWKIVYLPAASVIHYEGKSSEQVRALTHIRFGRSKVRYFYKHHGAFVGGLLRSWLLLNYVYEWVVEAAKWLAGHKRSLRRARMDAYEQVLRSGLRP